MRVTAICLFCFLLFPYTVSGDQEKPPAKVKTTAITQEEVAKNKPFIGLIYYDRQSNIASEVSGLVENVEVRTGDRVIKGAPLVTLNTEILDTEIALAKTRVKQNKLQADLTAKNFDRQKSLLASRGASQKKYDDAQFDLQNAAMDQQAAHQTLEKLLLQKKKSVISAPFDGIILEKNVDSGDWVQQGGTVATIGSTNDLFVRVPVAEKLIGFIHPDEEVQLVINAFNQKLTGIIDDTEPRADAKTKNIFVKIRIPAQGRVAENMTATVHLPISERKLLSIIPRDAMIKFQGKDFVYTIKEGKAAILPVNIVTFLGDRVAADNPYFVPGMPVITEGNERVRPDQAVAVDGEQPK